MKSLLLLSLLLASSALAETPRERYERTHRDRGPTTRYGAPFRTVATNSFRFVEYLESTGTQSINTGVVLTPAHRIEADFEFTQVSTKQQRVFEQYDRSGHLFVALYINGAGNIGYAWSQTAGDWKSVSKAISAARRKYVLDGPNRLLQVGATTATLPLVENTGPGEATVTLGSKDTSGVKPTYGKWYSAKIYNGDVLVRDFVPVAIGSTGYLLDRVSGRLFGNAGTGDFVLGPDVPLSAPVSLSPAAQRAFLAPRTDAPEEASDGDVWLDLVAIPEGVWLVERPVAGAATSAWHCALCDSRTLSALTWRHAVGLAPTNLPVTVAHDPSDVIGRVDRVFYERGTGVVARVQVRRSFYDRPGATTYRASPDVRCFTTGTNVAIRTDGWIHESQSYWTARAARLEAAAAATADPAYAARLSAELARIAALTNPPAVSAVVTAPIYLRGLSFVRSPMLPTSQVHPAVYGSFTNGYPVRTEWPNPQHTIP